ncbi:hypothetical protein IE81DRAFT_325223 [Ceraceosorus guamensis]|uniref:Uncharacterized protein n=1 Tax=Ceraceosorus guamensis TaxID=1522189 RepID=A0A316VZ50_9BASI|nr:hypothetical protein IE81DRAFT_325223 [Ceraceosorus guamensis]PWN40765.1 hypothetical protein IE81DRAFT_325223 [Ceraceosorus guamensis]
MPRTLKAQPAVALQLGGTTHPAVCRAAMRAAARHATDWQINLLGFKRPLRMFRHAAHMEQLDPLQMIECR